MKVKHIFWALLMLLFPLFSSGISNMVTFYADSVSASTGSQVTISIKVKNFKNILSAQGSINFNSSVLSYNSITQFGVTGMNISHFGLSQVSSGKLIFAWSDANLSPQSVADSSAIFTIKFNVIGTSGQQSAISITGTPLAIEVIGQNLTTLSINCISGKVLIPQAPPLTVVNIFADTISALSGSQVLVPVRVNQFKKMLSAQGTITFDTAVVHFSAITQMGISSLQLSDFGTSQTSNGKLMFSWSDPTLSGQSLSDSAILFTLKFTLNGSDGTQSSIGFSSNPTAMEFIDTSLTVLPFVQNAGKISVKAISQASTLSLMIDSTYGMIGQHVTLAVKVQDFANLISMQGSIAFDSSLLSFVSVQQFGMSSLDTSNFGLSGMYGGKLTFSWYDQTLLGQSLADSATIFSLTFHLIGAAGSQAAVNIQSSPLNLECIDKNMVNVPLILKNGNIQLLGTVTITPSSSISTNLCSGKTLNIPYTISGIFGSGNVFTAQLSDANGSFTNPTLLGSLQSNTSSTITGIIPQNIQQGSNYRIRILSTIPSFIGIDNGNNIFIQTSPIANAGNDTSFAANSIGVQIGSTSVSGYIYDWTPGFALSDSTISNPVANPIPDTTYILKVSNGMCESFDTVCVSLQSTFGISGTVTYDNSVSTPLNGLKLYLRNASNILIDSTTTNSLGKYNFLPQINGLYTISVVSNLAWGGVSSADKVVILRNTVGVLNPPLTGLRLLAADVNASGTANAADGTVILRRVVGVLNSFVAGDWKFNPETIHINGTAVIINFKGICVGDVNGSYVP